MQPFASSALQTSDSVEPPDALVDTSVAIALLLTDHEGHLSTVAALRGRRLGLAGHAWFEAYSVLTRLPPGARRSPADARGMLERNFPRTRFLDQESAATLRDRLATHNIAGGAVYDAMVGATAVLHGLPLITRDRRATSVYEALGVRVEFVA